MLYDKLASFGTSIDPTALTANTGKFLGDVITIAPGYQNYNDKSSGQANPVGAEALYCHIRVTTAFTEASGRTVFFSVWGGDALNGNNISTRTTLFGQTTSLAVTSTSNLLEAGDTFNIPLIINTSERAAVRNMQMAIQSSTAVADEAGRFDAWLSVSPPRQPGNVFIREGRAWYD